MKNPGNLAVATPSDREITMTRVFNAPRRFVFEAMTRPDLLKRWFHGPDGWSLEVCEVDLRVGGAYRYVWRGPDGTQMGIRGVCKELAPPEKIVQTEAFDESWYPGEAISTLALVEKEGKTTLTMTILYETREIRDAVLKTPMAEGVESGYGRLDTLLETLSKETLV
jgi:uncharacterized protein YndB with AHSA1/START domain